MATTLMNCLPSAIYHWPCWILYIFPINLAFIMQISQGSLFYIFTSYSPCKSLKVVLISSFLPSFEGIFYIFLFQQYFIFSLLVWLNCKGSSTYLFYSCISPSYFFCPNFLSLFSSVFICLSGQYGIIEVFYFVLPFQL